MFDNSPFFLDEAKPILLIFKAVPQFAYIYRDGRMKLDAYSKNQSGNLMLNVSNKS